MRRRWTILALVGAVIATAVFVSRTMDPREGRSHVERRAIPAKTDGSGSDDHPSILRTRNGYADVVEHAEERGATLREPDRYWFGVAIDERTREGEEGAAVRVESPQQEQPWPGSRTLERGVFVLAAPSDMNDPGDLRLRIEAADGRLGMRSVRVPQKQSTDVGRIVLRSAETMRGRCVDLRGDPIAAANLTLRMFGELKLQPGALTTAVSDDHGYFEFERVPFGMYALEGRAPDGSIMLVAPLAVPQDDLLIVRPVPTAPFSVFVRDSVGQPVSHGSVSAALHGAPAEFDPLGPQLLMSPAHATSDERGLAHLGHLPAGRYVVRVQIENNAFDFRSIHTGREKRPPLLTVPADPRIYVRCVFEDNKVAAAVKLTLDTPTGTERVVTSDAGIFAVNRGLPPVAQISASGARDGWRGSVSVNHDAIVEGQVAATLILSPAVAPGKETPRRVPRFALVTTPDGLPVRGARVKAGGKTSRTNDEGRASLGELSDDSVVHLVRRDLASGFPSSGKLGGLTTCKFVWHRGTEVRLSITDAAFGFRLDRGVRISEQPGAWKRVAPGKYVGLWDANTASPQAKMVVRARGYAPFELEPPALGAGAVERDVALVRAGAGKTGTLVLHVRRGGAKVLGARIRGNRTDPALQEGGRVRLVALSADRGRVILHDLAVGRWRFDVDADFDGSGYRIIAITPGKQELTLELSRAPAHRGIVVDPRGNPVDGAEVTVRDDQPGRVARTRADGMFVLNQPRSSGGTIRLQVKKTGYSTAYVDWYRRKGRWYRDKIVLRTTARLELPIWWGPGGSGAHPDDLRFRLVRVVGKSVEPVDVAVHVMNHRVVVEHAPRTRVQLIQLGGSAYAHTKPFDVGSGHTIRDPAVALLRGVTVQGSVRSKQSRRAFKLIRVRPAGSEPRTVQTDRDGKFVIRGLRPGTIQVEMNGQTAASRNRNKALRGKDGETLTVVIDA